MKNYEKLLEGDKKLAFLGDFQNAQRPLCSKRSKLKYRSHGLHFIVGTAGTTLQTALVVWGFRGRNAHYTISGNEINLEDAMGTLRRLVEYCFGWLWPLRRPC